MRSELLADQHRWLRVADAGWTDPLDPSYSAVTGNRWNPPGSYPVLYMNEDVVTARINIQLFLAGLPYGPEDLRDDTGPVLVTVGLPRHQRVADVHTPEGVAAVRLPASYPLDGSDSLIGHDVCRPIGVAAHEAGMRGVRCRSARAPYGAGRELAWFPASVRSVARALGVQRFGEWFWS